MGGEEYAWLVFGWSVDRARLWKYARACAPADAARGSEEYEESDDSNDDSEEENEQNENSSSSESASSKILHGMVYHGQVQRGGWFTRYSSDTYLQIKDEKFYIVDDFNTHNDPDYASVYISLIQKTTYLDEWPDVSKERMQLAQELLKRVAPRVAERKPAVYSATEVYE